MMMDIIQNTFLKLEKALEDHANEQSNTHIGTLLEEGIISMGLSQKVKGVFNHKGWFQWTFNFMLRKII